MPRSDSRLVRAGYYVDVYSADTSLGWRIVRQVTPLFAYDKVVSGKWTELFDDLGNFFGVQVVAAIKSDQELPSGTSATTITARDIVRWVGGDGDSRTIGMSEDRRITRWSQRKCKALPPEDRIERVAAKVQQWPFPASRIDNGRGEPVFGDRATRVYPRAGTGLVVEGNYFDRKSTPHGGKAKWPKSRAK